MGSAGEAVEEMPQQKEFFGGVEMTSREDRKKTYVAFLLDETGSMNSIRDEAISAFNEYVDSLRKESSDFYLTLTSFNSEHYAPRYIGRSINEVPPLTHRAYQPNHMTPLYDAMGWTFKDTRGFLEQADDNYRVLFVVLTDGHENHSMEYDQGRISRLTSEAREDGWDFVFLGADIDAWAQARRIGLRRDDVYNIDKARLRTSIADVANYSIHYAKGDVNPMVLKRRLAEKLRESHRDDG